MKQFDITYFYGPPSEYIVKEECIADIAASGITLCQLLRISPEAIKKALPILKKYGLKANIYENRITDVRRSGDLSAVDAVVKEVVEDYETFDNIAGWDICDEPSADDFKMLAAIAEAFRKYSPEKEIIINLYPNYSKTEQIKTPDYITYLEDFVKVVKPDLLSYDHYPFNGRLRKEALPDPNMVKEERERLIRLAALKAEDRDDFFENLEDIRRVGLENNLEQMLIIQLTEFGCCRYLMRPEILWEVNMCLVYGMHRISYFTYWLPEQEENDKWWSWDNSMCDRQGNKFDHYYDVQAINKQIRPIGEKLFETTSEAVFHIGKPEKATRQFEGYKFITDVVGENGVIGFFENGSVYLVNRDFRNENTFTVYSDKELFVYEKDAFISVGNTYTITLPAGAGVLMK